MTHILVTAPVAGALRFSEKAALTLVGRREVECFACEAPLTACDNCGALVCEVGTECDLPTPIEYERYAATRIDPAEWDSGCSGCLRDPYEDDRW